MMEDLFMHRGKNHTSY